MIVLTFVKQVFCLVVTSIYKTRLQNHTNSEAFKKVKIKKILHIYLKTGILDADGLKSFLCNIDKNIYFHMPMPV